VVFIFNEVLRDISCKLLHNKVLYKSRIISNHLPASLCVDLINAWDYSVYIQKHMLFEQLLHVGTTNFESGSDCLSQLALSSVKCHQCADATTAQHDD